MVIALLAGMMVTVIGCDSNKSEEKEPIKQVQEETQEQDGKEEVENVPEEKETEITSEEDDVNPQKDETGLYEDSVGIVEVSMATETSHVTFCTTVQINEKMTLMMWYGGPLVEKMSVQELGEKLYSLVTLV